MKALLSVGSVVIACACTAIAADPVQWIGTGEVASWTNAANWAGGVVPGWYVAPDGTNAGARGGEVEFIVGDREQTIDLDGLTSVSNVTMRGAGAGRYTFGTSSTQVLRLEMGGGLSIASDVRRTPLLVGAIGKTSFTGKDDAATPIIRNNSADTLVINDIGYIEGVSGWAVIYFAFAGTGDIRFDGESKSISLLGVRHLHSGRLIWNSKSSLRANIADEGGSGSVEVLEGMSYRFNSDGYQAFAGQTSKSKTFTYGGAGTLTVCGGKTENGLDPNKWCNGSIQIGYGTLRIATAHLTGKDSLSNSGHLVGLRIGGTAVDHDSWSTGTVELDSPDNQLCGDIEIYGGSALKASSFGLKSEQSRLGWCTNLYVCNRARLVYTGPGETTDRNIRVGVTPHTLASGNASVKEATFSLEHAGTGPLVVRSTVDATSEDIEPVVTLINNGTETATWASALDCSGLGVTKSGSGLWILSGANTYDGPTTVSAGTLRVTDPESLANSSAITLAGGTLEIPGSETATETTLKALNASANARLDVGYGRTLEFASVSVASGKTLAIVTGDDTTIVKVTGQTAGRRPASRSTVRRRISTSAASFAATGRRGTSPPRARGTTRTTGRPGSRLPTRRRASTCAATSRSGSTRRRRAATCS